MIENYRVHITYDWYNIACHVHKLFNTYQEMLNFYIDFRGVFKNDEQSIIVKPSSLPSGLIITYGLSVELDADVKLDRKNIWKITANHDGIDVTKEMFLSLNDDYNKWKRIDTIDKILNELG